jgi:hypothetical protein
MDTIRIAVVQRDEESLYGVLVSESILRFIAAQLSKP